jgi:long-chain acyl-CoA synthetase
MGEIVAATVVVNKDVGLNERDLQDQLAGELAAYKVPTLLSLVHAPLPRNAAGKVLKSGLRDELRAEKI